jgi:hypothetical protein
MSVTFAYDVPGFNYGQAPQGFQLCGYDTGSGGVAWTPAMWAAHPGAVHIDQAPDTAVLKGIQDDSYMFSIAGHVTSDVLDVEAGAVPVGSALVAAWARGAIASFAAGARPGQRRPLLYQSLGNVTANVNALIAGGVTAGVGLWIANWDGNSAADVSALAAASGPFPVAGFQYQDDGYFDADVFSTAWLTAVSGNAWVFGPCRDVQFRGGATTTFGVSGFSPGTPEPLGVGQYEFTVCAGDQFVTPAAGYPKYQAKDASSAQFSFTGHGLKSRQLYTAGVRAIATDGAHAGPWVTGRVIPGGS